MCLFNSLDGSGFRLEKPKFMYCIFIFCLSGDNDQTFSKSAAIRKSPRPAAREAAETLMRGLFFLNKESFFYGLLIAFYSTGTGCG
jgi:hypothetical protein